LKNWKNHKNVFHWFFSFTQFFCVDNFFELIIFRFLFAAVAFEGHWVLKRFKKGLFRVQSLKDSVTQTGGQEGQSIPGQLNNGQLIKRQLIERQIIGKVTNGQLIN